MGSQSIKPSFPGDFYTGYYVILAAAFHFGLLHSLTLQWAPGLEKQDLNMVKTGVDQLSDDSNSARELKCYRVWGRKTSWKLRITNMPRIIDYNKYLTVLGALELP